jgi:hypothetical protein
LRQSNISSSSDALCRAQTELRNYWKRDLEGKIGKPSGKYHGKGERNESAYTFSGGKQRGNQGRKNFVKKISVRILMKKIKGKEARETKVGENSKVIADIGECKGTRQMIAQPRGRESMNQV